MHRPLSELNKKSFELFHTAPNDVMMAKGIHALLNDYDKLCDVLGQSGYSINEPTIYQLRTGSLDLEGYIYRSMLSIIMLPVAYFIIELSRVYMHVLCMDMYMYIE